MCMKGEIVTLIGANGAGKSSTLRTIAGLVKPSGGTINFRGDDITGRDAHDDRQKGHHARPGGTAHCSPISRCWKISRSARISGSDDISERYPVGIRRFSRACASARGRRAARFPAASSRCWPWAARSWHARSSLMMDEPSLGLAPLVVRDIFEIIRQINRQGVTILLIEQNANMALKVADSAYVMETGRITLSGAGKDLLNNEAVKKAYLGT